METIQFCAIDPSITSTGIAILQFVDESKFRLVDKTSLVLKGKKFPNHWEKKLAALELFEFWLTPRLDQISFFVFENYSYGSPGKLADLGEMVGLMKKFLSDNDKAFDVVAPKSVKKLISGSGNASKEDVLSGLKTCVSNYDDIKFNNFDESDAAAVGIAYALMMGKIINESEKD